MSDVSINEHINDDVVDSRYSSSGSYDTVGYSDDY